MRRYLKQILALLEQFAGAFGRAHYLDGEPQRGAEVNAGRWQLLIVAARKAGGGA